MAKLHKPSAPSAAGAPRPADGAGDLDVLFPPEITVDIAGEQVTFREYRFVQSLALDGVLKPIIDGVATRCAQSVEPGMDDLLAVVIQHHDSLAQLVATSCNRDPSWFDDLDDEDGQHAVEGWLAANAGFFVRRVGRELTRRVMEAVQPFAGAASSASSSNGDTAGTSTTSGDTRSAS